ncbi:MAG: hypothetical protein IKR04_06280 [Clostridia bacterium]|nr:hypothetical protein [Clostridia bacterium]
MNYTEKNKLLDRVSVIALMCIFVELFLYGSHYSYNEGFTITSNGTNIPFIMNVFGVVFLCISIILFVMAFRKSTKKYLLFAIEFLVLAFLCPFVTYLNYPKYFGLTKSFLSDVLSYKVLCGIVLVYYICRVLYVCFHDYKVINFKKLSKRLKKRKSN